MCAPVGKGPRSLHKAFLFHQVAAYIRMNDQRIGWSLGVFHARDITALQPVFGIVQSVLIGYIGLCIALHAHTQPCFVHHREHGAHALMRLAHQIPFGTVVIHHASGIAVNAHFLF